MAVRARAEEKSRGILGGAELWFQSPPLCETPPLLSDVVVRLAAFAALPLRLDSGGRGVSNAGLQRVLGRVHGRGRAGEKGEASALSLFGRPPVGSPSVLWRAIALRFSRRSFAGLVSLLPARYGWHCNAGLVPFSLSSRL